MNHYADEINIYFELKGTPDSSRESYFQRINAFIQFIQDQNKSMKDITESDIQQYILYLKKNEHINVKSIKNTLIKLRNRLQLDKNISAHTLRHCFATHALEDGVDPVFIQQMLGHKHLQTTLTTFT